MSHRIAGFLRPDGTWDCHLAFLVVRAVTWMTASELKPYVEFRRQELGQAAGIFR
jgi:hypothetical protein